MGSARAEKGVPMRNRMVIAAVVALVAGGLLAAVPASAGSREGTRVRRPVPRRCIGGGGAGRDQALGGRVVEEISAIGAAKV